MKVVILGAGGHAMVVYDALSTRGALEVMGFVGTTEDGQQTLLGVPVFSSLSDVGDVSGVSFVAAVGENHARQREFDRARAGGGSPVNAIHPAAVLSARCQLGAGVMAMAGAVVNIGSVIGDNVILNTACSVDHHCSIGAHTHIAPGARLAGNVTVGQMALIGAGAVILPGVSVGDGCTIGAGAVVTKNVPSGCTAVGVPARIVAGKRV
jgi:sugar O-acyltransferase (sialic acid O-acetyltransferase NeuD family)